MTINTTCFNPSWSS